MKRSLGGLRDIHLMRWIGFARYGTSDIDRLRLQGAIHKDDARKLLAAHEYLMRVRFNLHLSSGKEQEVLTREEQLRIAEESQIKPKRGQRPVEQLMQTYFRYSTCVADISQRFVELHRPQAAISRGMRLLTTHASGGLYKVSHDQIDVYPRHRDLVCSSTERLLKLFRAAQLYGVEVNFRLFQIIKQSVPNLRPELTRREAQLFLDVLAVSWNVARTLRAMYDTGLLEVILPDMAHARCLLQFNRYHSYTVDEHTLRTIEAAEQFGREEEPVGLANGELLRKDILHLALLLHDLGKGFEEDHSEVGRQIAQRVAKRLFLSDDQREVLVFLVHKHLSMSHLAFRRDTGDLDLLIRFGHDVGTPEILRILYVLTAADLKAVGPGVWTDWKAELLSGLVRQDDGYPWR